MAINIKKNQALAFGPNGPAQLPCNCGGNYCQPFQTNDSLRIQGTVTPSSGVNISDFSRWTFDPGSDIGQGWRLSDGVIYGINVASGTEQAISNNLNMQPDVYYNIYADITTIATGTKQYFLLGVEFGTSYVNVPGDTPSIYYPGLTFRVIGTQFNDGEYTIDTVTYFPGVDSYTQLALTTTTVAETTGNMFLVLSPSYAPVPNEGYRFKINGTYLPLPVVTPDSSSGATSQAYLLRWFYTSGTITDNHLRIETTNSDLIVIVNSIYIEEISRVGIGVYSNGALSSQLDNPVGIVAYYPQNTYISNVTGTESLPFIPVRFNVNIDFATFAGTITGCTYLSLYDSTLVANAIFNGTFNTSLDGWNAGEYWAWDSGTQRAKYTPPSSGSYSPGMLTQTVSLSGGLSYRMDFNRYSGGAFGQVLVDMVIDGFDYPLGTFLGPLAHAATVDLTSYSGIVNVTIRFREVNQNEQIAIDDVVLSAASPDTFNVSNCIDMRVEHDCTLLFSAQNNDNAFDFDYTLFQHFLRVKAKMDVTAYPEETETPYIFSNNSRVLMFARRDKEYSVFIADAPDHIHDCLSILRLHDLFRIGTYTAGSSGNLQAYVKESAYELNRRKTSALKQATFTVRETTGVGSNFPCL